MKDFKNKLYQWKENYNSKKKKQISKQFERKESIAKLLYHLKFFEINLKSALKTNRVNEILNLQKKIDSTKKELSKISKKHSQFKNTKKIKKDDEYYLRGASSPLGRMIDDPMLKLPINLQAGTYKLTKRKKKRHVRHAYKHVKKS